MNFPPLLSGIFLHRDNRFRATVEVDGLRSWAHVPNSGRLTELFQPGQPIWLAPAAANHRKTAFDLKLVEYQGVFVSVDARLPNPLLAEALANHRLPSFNYPIIKREVTTKESRLDFRLASDDQTCWLETKSVTLVIDEVARFPDAPTDRGRKHLNSLIDLRKSGDRAAVVFVVQRPDTSVFAPHREADPLFATTLAEAADAGVEVLAYRCETSLQDIIIADEIPVYLDG